MATRTAAGSAQHASLLEVAGRLLEKEGPEALQARRLAAEIGASTQAIYTLFGGMPGLFEALVADGFARFARHVAAVPETDDPVADHFAKGAAFCEWALLHPQLYRLMFGLTGDRLRLQVGLEVKMSSASANFPEGQTAVEVLMRSLERVKSAGRIRPVETTVVAGQFLSATHGWVLLAIGGAFDVGEEGREILGQLAVNLMVGLGDSAEAAERSLAAAAATIAPMLSSTP
jgi:AcrR family transcriptional regulator